MRREALDKGAAGTMRRFAMSDNILEPVACTTMIEVRRGVDATDRALLALIDRRFAYMRAAARIKERRETVRDEPRKAAVIAAVVADAEERGLPAEELAAIWEKLVEASIGYEFDAWDELRR